MVVLEQRSEREEDMNGTGQQSQSSETPALSVLNEGEFVREKLRLGPGSSDDDLRTGAVKYAGAYGYKPETRRMREIVLSVHGIVT